MKFGTDTYKFNMEIGSVNSKDLVNYSGLYIMPLEEFNDYITLHNLSVLLTLKVHSDPLPYALQLLGNW